VEKTLAVVEKTLLLKNNKGGDRDWVLKKNMDAGEHSV
jgi:hypothetical protein